MLAIIQRQYSEGFAGRKLAPITGKLQTRMEKGVQALDLWPAEWTESLTDGHGYQPLATLWRYELRSIRHGNLSIWGVERIGQGARARWFGQTWEVEWTSEESLRRRESIKTGELPPSIKQMYPDADDPDSPFA